MRPTGADDLPEWTPGRREWVTLGLIMLGVILGGLAAWGVCVLTARADMAHCPEETSCVIDYHRDAELGGGWYVNGQRVTR